MERSSGEVGGASKSPQSLFSRLLEIDRQLRAGVRNDHLEQLKHRKEKNLPCRGIKSYSRYRE